MIQPIFFALQQIFSWGSTDAEASTFSNRKDLVHQTGHTFVSLVHKSSPVHSYPQVLAPRHTPIITSGTSDPPSPLCDLPPSPASVTPTGNPTPHNNTPNPVPNIPSGPDSDPSLSDSSSLNSYDSSDDGYLK